MTISNHDGCFLFAGTSQHKYRFVFVTY